MLSLSHIRFLPWNSKISISPQDLELHIPTTIICTCATKFDKPFFAEFFNTALAVSRFLPELVRALDEAGKYFP